MKKKVPVLNDALKGHPDNINIIRNHYYLKTFDNIETAGQASVSRREAEKILLCYIRFGSEGLANQVVDELKKAGIPTEVGEMSENPLHQARYMIVSGVTLFSREAIDYGLPEHLAYNISDSFIRYADQCQNVDEVTTLFFQAFVEFCRELGDWRLKDVRPEIRKCCEYIASHIHKKISLADLSSACGMSENYISKLFAEELGLRPIEYIRKEKINYAAFILRNTQAGMNEIAEVLSLPGASAFCTYFKKEYGLTPKAYRLQNQHAISD